MNSSDGTLDDDIIKELEDIGVSETPKYSKLVPIEGSSQKALAGKGGDVKPTYVGHVSYCSDLDELVYEVQKERHHLLDKVEGKGVSISTKIINALQNEYQAEYVFVGLRETGHVLVMNTDSFNKEWHTPKYDEQYYARLDKDVDHKISNNMDQIFSKHPNQSRKSITFEEAMDRITD